MKKIIQKYFLILFISTTIPVVAQQFQLDSVVKTINDKQSIISQKYNHKKKQAETIEYEKSKFGSEIQKTNKINILLDENGNEIETIFSNWNNDTKQWNETDKTKKQYNSENILVGFTTLRSYNGKMEPKYEFKKLNKNDTIIEINSDFNENKLQPINKSLSLRNSSNKITIYKTMLWSDSLNNWKKFAKMENHYKNDTILIGHENYEWKKNEWKKQEKVTYSLDKKYRNTNNYILYIAKNDEWIPKNKFERIELKEQNKELNTTYSWSNKNNNWFISSQVIIYFNEKGEKQDVDFFDFDEHSQKLKRQSEQLNLYDNQGRLTHLQNIFHNEENITGVQNIIKFDKEGNVSSEAYYELDQGKNTWNNKLHTEFIFDNNIILEAERDNSYHKISDYFNLNKHNYINNKFAVKKVKIYNFKNGEKKLTEEYEYFYSEVK